MFNTRVLQAAAMVLLLLAGAETLFCQMLAPGSCQFTATERGSDDSSDVSADDCLCCCLVRVSTFPLPEPSRLSVTLPEAPSVDRPVPPEPSVYHPPLV